MTLGERATTERGARGKKKGKWTGRFDLESLGGRVTEG